MLVDGRSAIQYFMAALLGACLFVGISCAAESTLSEQYTMEIDPAAKQQLGEKTFNEIMDFFHAAEKAIETKDLDALMSLYSDDYSNDGHDKKSVELIWKRIFSTFDTIDDTQTVTCLFTSFRPDNTNDQWSFFRIN